MPSITIAPSLKNHTEVVVRATTATFANFVASPGPYPTSLLFGASKDCVPPPGLIRHINSVLVGANSTYRL